MPKRKAHIITYTHWDREFRWEFERTRMRLVDCIDHLLDIMKEKADYKSFLLDGQLTLIEDYLEIRPEKKEEIIDLAQAGRLELGPWYTLADCAPIQGESVVRNILYGIRKSREYGNVLKCGYNVFSFGQISQLPQIYANFGIDTIIFYKHMDSKRSKYHEFIWEAPDGTRALASRLGREARWNFFFAGHIPIVYGKDAWHKDWQYHWGELGKVFHTADPEGYEWFYEILDPETSFHKENIKMGLERALKTVEGTAAPECVLFFEGTDFTEPHPLLPDIIQEIQLQCGDEIEVVHSRLTDYFRELKTVLKDRSDLDIVKGPMRDGPVGSIHTDVFTTHPEVMIENSQFENKLIRYAEPLSMIAWKYNLDCYPATYLEKIWKLMFQSHAHDSIHGLGPKTLVEGEIARLKQAKAIAQGLERRALQNITKEINTSQVEDSEYFLAVHNPSSFIRSEVVEAYIDLPKDVRLNYLIIEDMQGNSVQVQEVDRKETRAGIYHPRSRNMPFYCTKVHVFFMAADIPPLGYKTFKIKWVQKNEYPYPHEEWDTPRIDGENMLSGINTAENDFIKVRVNPDGTVNITDKKTGKEYSGLNYFMDMGDKGNMWSYDRPGNDKIINSLGSTAKVAVITQGSMAVKFEIRLKMILPAEFDWLNHRRSEVEKELPIRVELTLKKGNRYLEVNTTVDNTVKDHYFKVCFPTDLKAEKTWAEGSFTVTEYPVNASINNELRGDQLARHPAQLWFDLCDGENGLSILTDATKDYEILENDPCHQTIAMGLLRVTRLRIPCDNRLWMEYPGDESSQSLGKLYYRYAFLPHIGLWDEARLYNEALAFDTPMHVCQFGKQEGIFPTEKTFLEIKGDNLILSAIKKAENRETILIRLFNPTEKEIAGSIHVGFQYLEVFLVNLNEERLQRLDGDGEIHIKVGRGKIISLEFAF
jgi:mannosylglycerate hydrolase